MTYLRNSFSTVFVILLFSFCTARANDSISTELAPPLDIPLMISGNFGDVRASSFHFGIDFRTREHIGWPVFSIADGYVARVKVEPGGYGRAIYIKHKNGSMSVYSHLERFYDELNQFIKDKQYSEKSFYQDVALTETQFVVKKCDLIGYSGNSGQSSGAHLHFEIRDYVTQNPMNGMVSTFPIMDTVPPQIRKIWIYDNFNFLDAHGLCKKSYNIQRNKGKLILSPNKIVRVPSSFFIGLEAFDNITDTDRKLSFFSSRVFVDSLLVFHLQFDEMQFDQTGSVNALIDYKYKLTSNENIYHQFLFPNQDLVAVRYAENRGLINLNDSLVHNICIKLVDISGNESELIFKVLADHSQNETCRVDTSLEFLQYAVENTINYNGLKIVVPAKSLYADVCIDVKGVGAKPNLLSEAVAVGDRSIPVRKPFKVYFQTNGFSDSIKSKLLVVNIDDDGSRNSIGGEIQNNLLVAGTKYFGVFGMTIDTVAPKITPLNIANRRNMASELEIRIKISDDLSGIGEYKGYIDNKWALFEYDQKSNTIIHRFDNDRFTYEGKKHILKLFVSDKRNNRSLLSLSFIK